jgi:hypothetical protein
VKIPQGEIAWNQQVTDPDLPEIKKVQLQGPNVILAVLYTRFYEFHRSGGPVLGFLGRCRFALMQNQLSSHNQGGNNSFNEKNVPITLLRKG